METIGTKGHVADIFRQQRCTFLERRRMVQTRLGF